MRSTPTPHDDLTTIDEVSKTLLSQVEEFFISYNRQRGKKFKVTGTGGPRKALKFLKNGIKSYKPKRNEGVLGLKAPGGEMNSRCHHVIDTSKPITGTKLLSDRPE